MIFRVETDLDDDLYDFVKKTSEMLKISLPDAVKFLLDAQRSRMRLQPRVQLQQIRDEIVKPLVEYVQAAIEEQALFFAVKDAIPYSKDPSEPK